MNKFVLYTTHCPKCKILEKKLKDKDVQYEEVTDVNTMLEKGLKSAPNLEVTDENGETTIYDFTGAIAYVKNL